MWHLQGSGDPLECYSAADYYSTLKEYNYMEQDYDSIIKKVLNHNLPMM